MNVKIVVPWHRTDVFEQFLEAWGVDESDERFVFVSDEIAHGCAAKKNAGIQLALRAGANVIGVLDDDCLPSEDWPFRDPVAYFIEAHLAALEPQPVEMFRAVTDPRSRGTPELPGNRFLTMPVAASMGFWNGVGDYSAALQLAHGGEHPMQFDQRAIHGQYFALSGMNLAFRREWAPLFRFADVPRYDDIWMGLIAQKVAYARGHCFSLSGPVVHHSRQSNVWQNLREEADHGPRNETLWREIMLHPSLDPAELRAVTGAFS